MAQTNLIGKTILGYVVNEKLGSGAFGTVYKVIKTNASGQYIRALKHITIPTEKQYNSVLNSMGGDISKADNYFSQMLQNIVSEIRILNDLSEKGIQNIVRYYENDICSIDSPKRYDIFILMEYLTPLEEFIVNADFLVRDVVRLGLDILSGLQSCHNNGVIHRDIKDENIFVSDKGEYKIGDFGVSKVLKDSSKAESLKGTPNFLAPEVYLGKEGYTKSVDLYSLGIVLYRLLNYNRNPFLPCFPKQFFAQDEDKAFEERMSGKTPELPFLGGNQIGQVIVKAIANSSERFQTAEEFRNALEYAISNTSADVLDEKIKFNMVSGTESINETKNKEYRKTIGEVTPLVAMEKELEDEKNSSINKHLFESIGEVPPIDVPKIESVIRNEYKSERNNTSLNTNERVINIVSPTINEAKEPVALDEKVMNKVIFLMPVIIFLVGIITYTIVLPKVYGEVVSFIDWLFTGSQNIIDTLSNPNIVIPQVNSVFGMKIFWWIWLSCFITSLFVVGKRLHSKPEPNNLEALLTNKEPYLLIQDIKDSLKQVKMHQSSKQLDSLIYAVKKLEEKLSVESDFGYGKKSVISCENDIARQIQFLLDTIPCMENGNFDENLSAMNSAVMNINSLLHRRTELKKK